MRRRDFIAGLGAVAWPLAASAQRTSMRHIGVLSSGLADGGTALISVFAQGLQERGWTIGTNVRIDYRWARPTTISAANLRRNWLRSSRASF
jgi:hypothetical protein